MTPAKRSLIVAGLGPLVLFLLISVPGDGLCVRPKIAHPILRSGDPFPSLSFSDILSQGEKKYLGIEGKTIIFLEDIQAEALVIKYLNTNCIYCIKSLPVFKKVFETIERDGSLRKKIKIMAISAGDTPTEVAAFKEQHTIPYPMIPDPEFEAHKAVNEPTVPFIVVARKGKQGKWTVAAVHVGLTFSAESFVGELKAILEIDPNDLKMN